MILDPLIIKLAELCGPRLIRQRLEKERKLLLSINGDMLSIPFLNSSYIKKTNVLIQHITDVLDATTPTTLYLTRPQIQVFQQCRLALAEFFFAFVAPRKPFWESRLSRLVFSESKRDRLRIKVQESDCLKLAIDISDLIRRNGEMDTCVLNLQLTTEQREELFVVAQQAHGAYGRYLSELEFPSKVWIQLVHELSWLREWSEGCNDFKLFSTEDFFNRLLTINEFIRKTQLDYNYEKLNSFVIMKK